MIFIYYTNGITEGDLAFPGSRHKYHNSLSQASLKPGVWNIVHISPYRLQGPKHLNHYLLPPRVCISLDGTQTQAL